MIVLQRVRKRMKIKTLELLRWQKSAQFIENNGRHLRLLAKVAVESAWIGVGDGAGIGRGILRLAIFGCEHAAL